MSRFFWNSAAVPAALDRKLRAVAACTGIDLAPDTGETELTFLPGSAGTLGVRGKDGKILISADSDASYLRGVGAALAGIECAENSPFTTFGIMLDCSRNKVFRIDWLKRYIARMALLGYNTVMLYCEDTYRLPNRPLWGYMRGAYTMEELHELDDFADSIGVELVGCIQTLGHLSEALQWGEAFDRVKDTGNVLMVDEPETYRLIAEMLDFWKHALRSRRIHIGMDETHDLGRGRYMDRNGYCNPFELFNRHLGKVADLCHEAGFMRPTIWSDMYFRLTNPGLDYYNDEKPIPAEVVAKIPESVQLCYWDYYHKDEAFYRRYLKHHLDLRPDPLMGSGVWTWSRAWYDHRQTEETVRPCIAACRAESIKELVFTMWGDNGGYCLYGSSLAGLAFAADLAYGRSGDETALLERRLAAIGGGEYELTCQVAGVDTSFKNAQGGDESFACGSMLWDDPLYAIQLRAQLVNDPDFIKRAKTLWSDTAAKVRQAGADRRNIEFETIALLCEFLAAKVEFRERLMRAYELRDFAALRRLKEEIPAIAGLLRQYDRANRAAWLSTAKPFGLEVLQRRNAGQLARWMELETRLDELLSGVADHLEELDESRDAVRGVWPTTPRVSGSNII